MLSPAGPVGRETEVSIAAGLRADPAVGTTATAGTSGTIIVMDRTDCHGVSGGGWSVADIFELLQDSVTTGTATTVRAKDVGRHIDEIPIEPADIGKDYFSLLSERLLRLSE